MVKEKFKKAIAFILNPKLLLCFAAAWMITNGWAYVMLGVGLHFGIGWMSAVGGGYIAFLWLPFTPEKIVTAAIAIALMRLLFPSDAKTLAIVREIAKNIKERSKKSRDKNGKK